MPFEECLPQVAYILPKIREVQISSDSEQQMSLKSIAELSLKIINIAHKLKSPTERFYVLLVALQKFVWCSFYHHREV